MSRTATYVRNDPSVPRVLELRLISPRFRSRSQGIYFTRVVSKTRTATTMTALPTDEPELGQDACNAALRRQLSALREEVASLRRPSRPVVLALEVSIV